METELRCGACIDKVVAEPKLLNGSNGWVIGADGARHWVRDGAAVCGETVLNWALER